MEYENRMEQHYAVSKGGVLLHIKEAHDSNEDCFCPYCGCRMLKRCGHVRTWHFAHDYRYENEVKKACSYESYLHAFAKLKIKQWFEESNAINLHYQQRVGCRYANTCVWKEAYDVCSNDEERVINLKHCLTECRLEETVLVGKDRYRADLLWLNPRKPCNSIMVEIKVTHECTSKKKESDARIIEFEVHSEEDVERIVNNDICESDTVKFYGFNYRDTVDDKVPAKHILNKFVYYRSGKAYPRVQCDCKTYMNRRKSALFEMSVKGDIDDNASPFRINLDDRCSSLTFGRFYNWGLSLAKTEGYDVRNCYLCKHHKYDFDNGVLSCELGKDKICEAKEAQECGNYYVDKDICDKNLEELRHYSQHNIVDIWSLRT